MFCLFLPRRLLSLILRAGMHAVAFAGLPVTYAYAAAAFSSVRSRVAQYIIAPVAEPFELSVAPSWRAAITLGFSECTTLAGGLPRVATAGMQGLRLQESDQCVACKAQTTQYDRHTCSTAYNSTGLRTVTRHVFVIS